MSSTPPGRRGGEQPHNVAAAIAEVSERATLLVREEIELAKAEVAEKATKLIKGAVVGVAAGIFFMTALVFALVGCAWLLYYFLPVGDFAFFWGFFAMAVILVLLGVLAGFVAARAVKKGSPPVPSMAFEEARKIRETVSAPGAGRSAADGPLAPGASFAAAPTAESVNIAPDGPPDAAGESPLSGEGDPVADVQSPPVVEADVVQESAAAEVDASAGSPPTEGADSSLQAPADEHDVSSSIPEDQG
ncbi:MAG TPA: phage holin family protein [Solirubrobacteraceae bacterium]|nr:phage holin family protein [Solirubrobacteraceae bacterium]